MRYEVSSRTTAIQWEMRGLFNWWGLVLDIDTGKINLDFFTPHAEVGENYKCEKQNTKQVW